MERNPNTYRSMRDYRNHPRMSVPSFRVPPTTAPYGNAYNPCLRDHLNLSKKPKPIQYAPPPHPQYASSSQPQPPQSTSPIEQAILNLTKLVGDFVEEQKTFNTQLNQIIHTVENSLNQKLDGLQSEMQQKFDNLQYSISRLTNQQLVYQGEVNLKEECLIDTTVEEQCKHQNEAISPLLTKEGSRKEAGEEPQKLILQPIPINLDPSATVQPKNSPLVVHILPTPAPHATPEIPTAKAIPTPLPMLQNFRKLVASVQTFATTSKTLVATDIAWYSGWFGC